MIHILAPRPGNASLPVIINIQGSVGENCSNNSEDVLFVKFCFKTMGSGPINPMFTTPGLRSQMASIVVNPSMDSTTLYVIGEYYRALKGDPGFMQQATISPAPNTSAYSDGSRPIYRLNQHLKFCLTDRWPNIGLLPGCPSGLAIGLRRALVGT